VTPAGLAAWSIGSRISRTLEIELSRPGVSSPIRTPAAAA